MRGSNPDERSNLSLFHPLKTRECQKGSKWSISRVRPRGAEIRGLTSEVSFSHRKASSDKKEPDPVGSGVFVLQNNGISLGPPSRQSAAERLVIGGCVDVDHALGKGYYSNIGS